MSLTDLQLRRLKPSGKAYKITDGGGLYIEVRTTGARLWRYRYKIAGRENVFAIGEYPEVSLSEARALRDEARAVVKQGIHPAHARRTEKLTNISEGQNTFQSVAEEFADQKSQKWSPRYGRQFRSAMAANVYPHIGSLPIRSVTSQHVLDVMRRMDKKGATTYALTVRQWCSSVFRYAVSTMRADTDPAAPLKGAFSRPAINHARPLSSEEISEFLERMEKFGGNRTTAICLELLLLTFVRTAEIRQAEWCDMDLDAGQWKIPAEKMKKRRVHVVPLSSQAQALIEELRTITGSGRWLFPNTRRPSDVMSPTTVNRALECMGYPTGRVTGHDFRATASTHLYEMGYRPEHIEMQLAHAAQSKTAAAYNHAQYLHERASMMQDWADYVYSLRSGSNVVRIMRNRGA